MKLIIDIPKEFEEHFNKDKFSDSLARVASDIESFGFQLAGRYEQETITMIRKAFEQATPLEAQRPKGKWIEYKVDIAPHPLHCSLCGFSNHHISNRYMREFRRCPNCGAEMEVDI